MIILVWLPSSRPTWYSIPPTDFTGAATEKGIGEGVGTNFNYPLLRGTQDDDYCATLKTAIENIRNFNPAYLLVRSSYTPLFRLSRR
jgi:acetoin utilization deacetylase AcuC-like enzyme